jgi:predicted secreted protein
MRLSVVQAVSVRLVASFLALVAAPAFAGDAADFAALGFSADGRYFAYEEFGVQDGSGFPYSNIFILDVAEDKWAGGSPFRVMLEEESPTLAGVRGEAMAKAAPALAKLDITEPAVIAAMHADGQPVEDRKTIMFGAPGFGLDEPDDSAKLSLSTFPSTSTVRCVEDFGFEPPVGFALVLEPSDRAPVQIYRDESVPASRNCTVDYRLSAVVGPVNWSWNNLTPVAIVSVFSRGFEGPDRRFIAVPLKSWP